MRRRPDLGVPTSADEMSAAADSMYRETVGEPVSPVSPAPPPAPPQPLTDDAGDRFISVTDRQAPPDYTFIPDDVKDYYSTRGHQVTLASGLSQSIQQLSLRSRFPVMIEDIDSDRREDFTRLLRRHGFVLRDGYAWKGDAILFAQPFEARAEQLRDGIERWVRTERGTEEQSMEAMNEELRKIPELRGGRTHVRRVEPGSRSAW
jgi:hypothetical protein